MLTLAMPLSICLLPAARSSEAGLLAQPSGSVHRLGVVDKRVEWPHSNPATCGIRDLALHALCAKTAGAWTEDYLRPRLFVLAQR